MTGVYKHTGGRSDPDTCSQDSPLPGLDSGRAERMWQWRDCAERASAQASPPSVAGRAFQSDVPLPGSFAAPRLPPNTNSKACLRGLAVIALVPVLLVARG